MLIDVTTTALDDARHSASDARTPDDTDGDPIEEAEAPWATDSDEWPPHFGAARLGIP